MTVRRDPSPDEYAYLDHAATTPMRPAARDCLVEWSGGTRGNPSGAHRLARDARRALDDSRDRLAGVLGCSPGDIVFTGGGTEADNLAVFGVAEAVGRPTAVACSAAEHHAVLEPVQRLGGTVLAVDGRGRLDPDEVAARLPADTALLSVMGANNEVGTITDLPAVIAAARARTDGRVAVHVDAVAAFPWLDGRALAADVDLLSISAHKFGGPQGVGVLMVRPGVPLRARLLGGAQERDRRSGTQNVAGIVAMATAAVAADTERADTVERVRGLRDRLVDDLCARLDGVHETVPRDAKVAGNAHLCVEGAASEELLFLLDRAGVCASAASSCASGAVQLSHVLQAMGVDPQRGAGAVRLTLGWPSTDRDVDRALDVLVDAIGRLRKARSCG